MHERGTVVVIEGPRFSTRAESRWYADAGWEVINMTQYPEAALARELELCYANVSLDHRLRRRRRGRAPGLRRGGREGVLREQRTRLRELLNAIAPAIPAERGCSCGTALSGARIGH